MKFLLLLFLLFAGCRSHNTYVIEIKPVKVDVDVNVRIIKDDSDDVGFLETITEFFMDNVYPAWLVLAYYEERKTWPPDFDSIKEWSLDNKLENSAYLERIQDLKVIPGDNKVFVDILHADGAKKRIIISK